MTYFPTLNLAAVLALLASPALGLDEVTGGACMQLGIASWYRANCSDEDGARRAADAIGRLIRRREVMTVECWEKVDFGILGSKTVANAGDVKSACLWAHARLGLGRRDDSVTQPVVALTMIAAIGL